MKPYLFKFLLSLGAAAALVSCREEAYLDGEKNVPGGYSDKVCFVVSNTNATRGGSAAESRRCGGVYLHSDDGKDSVYLALSVADAAPATRAAYLTEAEYNSLNMTCRRRLEGSKYDYYFYNTLFEKDADGVWTSSPPYWWLNNDTHFSFYGYAPADAQGVTFVGNEPTCEPALDYTVPKEVKAQSDLVYNTLRQEYIASANQIVPLSMTHALANVAFKTGTGMAAGILNKVTLKNVLGHGTLNLTNDTWTLDPASATDFSVSMDKASADAQEITTNADKTYFMLLPGCNSEATTVEIEFTKADGTTATYTGSITDRWEAGKQYRYSLTVDPDFTIQLEDSKPQDAHYVICKATVTAANMQPGQEWELKATASDGAKVTLLSQLNSYQQAGYWTDEIWEQGVNETEPHNTYKSARGDATLTGTGNSEVYIFLPENVGEENRTITLSITVKGSPHEVTSTEITQLCPDWNDSGFGWEQVEYDLKTQWGFQWDRIVTYTKNNIGLNRFVYGEMIKDLVTQYKATEYTTVSNTGVGQRTTVRIDYTKLNTLPSSLNSSDGLSNTQTLFGFAGGAVTGNLEQAILDLAPGLDFWLLRWYRRCGEFTPIVEQEGLVPSSEALGLILRKNRYNIVRIEKDDNGSTDVSESPVLNTEEGIVWFLPAKDQFGHAPVKCLLNGDYWSSSPVEDGSSNIYTSSGSAGRLDYKKIRACRNRP